MGAVGAVVQIQHKGLPAFLSSERDRQGGGLSAKGPEALDILRCRLPHLDPPQGGGRHRTGRGTHAHRTQRGQLPGKGLRVPRGQERPGIPSLLRPPIPMGDPDPTPGEQDSFGSHLSRHRLSRRKDQNRVDAPDRALPEQLPQPGIPQRVRVQQQQNAREDPFSPSPSAIELFEDPLPDRGGSIRPSLPFLPGVGLCRIRRR